MLRAGNIVLNIMSLAVVGAGMALIGTFFFPSAFLDSGSENQAIGAEPREFNVPVVSENTTPEMRPETAKPGGARKDAGKTRQKPVYSPENDTLILTIPAMSRIENDEIPTGDGKEERLFRNYAAVHLEGTGYPWQKGSNVYIAGHRLGYPGTESFLTFADLNRLETGDRIRVHDANGRRYVYEVFKEFVVGPTEVSVTAPVQGKSVLTLQTCTLPSYSKRLIVQAEKVA